MRILQIINEIKTLKNNPTHKSTIDICRLLENNEVLFLEKIELDNYNHLIKNFEQLSQVNAKEYNTPNYINDYEKAHSILSFYVDRVI